MGTPADHSHENDDIYATTTKGCEKNASIFTSTAQNVNHGNIGQLCSLTDCLAEIAKREARSDAVASTSAIADRELFISKAEAPSNTQVAALSATDAYMYSCDPPTPSSNSFDGESFTSGSDALSQKSNYDIYLKCPAASSSKRLEFEEEFIKRKKVDLYGPDEGPKLYNIKGNLVTPPVIAKNLPEIFDFLPIYGRPTFRNDMDTFYSNKIREFVGFDLNDEQFEKLEKLCSPDYLRTGKELVKLTPFPTQSVLTVFEHKEYDAEDSQLCIVKKQQLRLANDPTNSYQKRLKYRGVRLMPLSQPESEEGEEETWDLEPGKDVLYRVRIYRPFPYNIKEKHVTRHSVFSRDAVLPGRARLSALRDRLACANDAGLRLDASAAPAGQPATTAKDLFPSGFLFINNTFYVDERRGCADRSAPLREWARARGLGDFPRKDLHATRLEQLRVRLGHPEVYVHQGNCEHVFTFSEIRLLSADDPLSSRQYPAHTAVSQNQSIYCTTCAEFGARWVVVGCATVPFDPAYFCDKCLKMYLYKDGVKLGDFKCYSYRGNEINMLKPQR